MQALYLFVLPIVILFFVFQGYFSAFLTLYGRMSTYL